MTTIGNTDYSQYQQWQPYTTPSGEVYYQVPNTGWLYDPFTSSQTGKIQLFSRQSLEQKQKNAEREQVNQDLQDKAQRLALEQAKPGRQLLQAVTPVAGLLAGKYAYDTLFSGPASTAPTTAATPASKGFFSGLTDWASNLFGGGSGNTGGGAGGGELTPEVNAIPGLLEQAPGSFGSFLPAAGVAAGAYLGYESLKGIKEATKGHKLSTPQKIALALPTFGASFLPFGQKSTKEQVQDRWGNLAEKGVTGAKEAFLAAHGDEGAFGPGVGEGKQWNWEDAVARARLNPAEFRGAYGNFETFGNDWMTYSPQEQDEIVARLINENLYDPEKGDITIADKERARQIKDEVLSKDPQTSAVKPPAQQTSAVKPPALPQLTVQGSGFMLPNAGLPFHLKGLGLSGGPLPIKSPSPVSSPPSSPPPAPPKSAPIVMNGAEVGKALANRFNKKFGEPS